MTQEASKQYLPRERVVQDNLALMRRYFDLLYTKDLDAMLELVDDDIEWLVVPTGDVISGKASLAELAENHWGASPDRTKRLLNLFATEEYACMEYISGGTLTGEVDFRSIKIPHRGGPTRSSAASSSTSRTAGSTASTSTSTWTRSSASRGPRPPPTSGRHELSACRMAATVRAGSSTPTTRRA
jgi:hypothetical protein